MSAEVMAATIAGLQAERAEMAAKVVSLEESLTDLAHENAMLKRRLFGSKTERFRTSELQLALGDLLAAEVKLQADLDASIEKAKDAAPTPDASEGTGKARPHGRRNLFASNLPRVPVEIRDSALEARGARLIRFEARSRLELNYLIARVERSLYACASIDHGPLCRSHVTLPCFNRFDRGAIVHATLLVVRTELPRDALFTAVGFRKGLLERLSGLLVRGTVGLSSSW